MDKSNSAIESLASRMNKAEGVVEGIDAIIDFEAIMNRNQSRVDEIVNEQKRSNDVPENLVAEIEEARGRNKGTNNSKLEGKVAEVEKGLKKLMEAGEKPSHAVIEDDKFEIFGRKDEEGEPDR